MLVLPSKLNNLPPRASRHIDRDTAVRWRAVPADQCHLSGDHLYIPRQFMLVSEAEQQDLLYSLQSRVLKLEQIISDLGHSVAPSAKVIPMRSNAKQTEQSKVEVVPGNEAEELYPQPTEPDTATEPVQSALAEASKTSGKIVNLSDKAANDEVIEAKKYLNIGEPKKDRVLEQITTLDDTTLVNMDLSPFGFTSDEALGILKAEHAIRDAHCKRKHNGVNYIDTRLLRQYAKDGVVTDQYYKSEQSNYAQFEARMAGFVRVPDYENPLVLCKWQEYVAYIRGLSYTPEACRTREKRRVARLKLDMQSRQGSAHFQRVMSFAVMNSEAHESKAPFSWRAKRRAMSTRMADRWDVVRGWFGRPPVDRSRKAREQIAEDFAAEDANVPMSELVRRYQHKGISPC